MEDLITAIMLAICVLLFIMVVVKTNLFKKDSKTELNNDEMFELRIRRGLSVMQETLDAYKENNNDLKKIIEKDNSIISKQSTIIELLKKERLIDRNIVCLCGSTKFKDAFEKANREETAKGNIVLTVAMFGHIDGLDMDGEEKKTFDAVHFDKILLADEILVLNVDNYIGESTNAEIEFAIKNKKKVRFLNHSTDVIKYRERN